MYTAQQRHAEDKRQLMEEICHTAEDTPNLRASMRDGGKQHANVPVAVQMSQVARQKRKETLNEERKNA